MGLPGHHPRLENVAGLNRTRPSTTMRTAGGLSTAGGASTVTLHDHAHRRWPGYPRVLWVRDVCQCLVGARLSRRRHGGALPWRLCRGDALVSWRHHGGAPPSLSRHIGAWLLGRCVCGALPWRSRHDGVCLRRRHRGGVLPLSLVAGRGGEDRISHARR